MLNSSSCCSLQLKQWLLEKQLQQAAARTGKAAKAAAPECSQPVSKASCCSDSCWLCSLMQRPHQPTVVL
jgi:hypothetical protein